MHTPLPGALELVKTSFTDAIKYRKDLWKVNLLGFVAPLAALLVGVAFAVALVVFNFMGATPGKILLFLLGLAIFFVLAIWYGVHYLLRVLHLLKGNHEPISPRTSWNKLPGMLLVSVLHALSLAAAPFIASIILFLTNPGLRLADLSAPLSPQALLETVGLGGIALLVVALLISLYLAIRLQFSGIVYLQEEQRGVKALKYSWAMTGPHFWTVAGRLIVFTVSLYLLVFVVTLLLMVLGESSQADLIRFLVNTAVQAFLLMPVAIFFQAHLYQAYKHMPSAGK